MVKKLIVNASFGISNDGEAGRECLVRSFKWRRSLSQKRRTELPMAKKVIVNISFGVSNDGESWKRMPHSEFQIGKKLVVNASNGVSNVKVPDCEFLVRSFQ